MHKELSDHSTPGSENEQILLGKPEYDFPMNVSFNLRVCLNPDFEDNQM